MSKSKMIGVVIVVILIVIACWMYFGKSSVNAPVTYSINPSASTQTATASTGVNGTATSSVSGTTDDSDASLNADMGNIDTQMSGLDSDSSTTLPASDNQ